jgi:hypothetical protein
LVIIEWKELQYNHKKREYKMTKIV